MYIRQVPLVVCLLLVAAVHDSHAQSTQDANALYVKAHKEVVKGDEVRSASYAKAYKHYAAAERALKTIVDDYPSSDIAVDIVRQDGSIGSHELTAFVNEVLPEYKDLATLESDPEALALEWASFVIERAYALRESMDESADVHFLRRVAPGLLDSMTVLLEAQRFKGRYQELLPEEGLNANGERFWGGAFAKHSDSCTRGGFYAVASHIAQRAERRETAVAFAKAAIAAVTEEELVGRQLRSTCAGRAGDIAYSLLQAELELRALVLGEFALTRARSFKKRNFGTFRAWIAAAQIMALVGDSRKAETSLKRARKVARGLIEERGDDLTRMYLNASLEKTARVTGGSSLTESKRRALKGELSARVQALPRDDGESVVGIATFAAQYGFPSVALRAYRKSAKADYSLLTVSRIPSALSNAVRPQRKTMHKLIDLLLEERS